MKVKINGKKRVAYEEETILELAKRKKIDIPSLCHKKGFEGLGRCRMCLVEINDGRCFIIGLNDLLRNNSVNIAVLLMCLAVVIYSACLCLFSVSHKDTNIFNTH